MHINACWVLCSYVHCYVILKKTLSLSPEGEPSDAAMRELLQRMPGVGDPSAWEGVLSLYTDLQAQAEGYVEMLANSLAPQEVYRLVRSIFGRC